MNNIEVFLIRHGKTIANEKRLYCGKTDIWILYLFLIISSLAFVFLIGFKFILVPTSMIIVALLSVNKSTKELGGMSGDSAGYGLVIAEVIGILILSII